MSRYVNLDGMSWDGKPISSKIQEVQTKHGRMQGITIGWLWGDNVPHIDLEEHDKHIIEQYKANTDLKNTIKDIHDNVSKEMYCKGIDDFVEKVELKYLGVNPDELYEKHYPREICEQIKEIAEQLKAGEDNANKN